MVPKGLKANFPRKMKKQKKIDNKLALEVKNRLFDFSTKIGPIEVSNRFLVEK